MGVSRFVFGVTRRVISRASVRCLSGPRSVTGVDKRGISLVIASRRSVLPATSLATSPAIVQGGALAMVVVLAAQAILHPVMVEVPPIMALPSISFLFFFLGVFAAD